MKQSPITLLLAAVLLWTGTIGFAAPPQLNAKELAYHLGINSWVSQFRLTDHVLTVELCMIRDGRIGEVILSSKAFPTDRELTRLAIIAGPMATSMPLSLQIEAAPSPRKQMRKINLDYRLPLPSVIAEGDFVLGGSPYDSTRFEKLDVKEVGPQHLKEGLLLRVK